MKNKKVIFKNEENPDDTEEIFEHALNFDFDSFASFLLRHYVEAGKTQNFKSLTFFVDLLENVALSKSAIKDVDEYINKVNTFKKELDEKLKDNYTDAAKKEQKTIRMSNYRIRLLLSNMWGSQANPIDLVI